MLYKVHAFMQDPDDPDFAGCRLEENIVMAAMGVEEVVVGRIRNDLLFVGNGKAFIDQSL